MPVLVSVGVAAPAARAEDPPVAWVGRIARADGAVAARPAGGEWADSPIDMPIAAGMSLRTDAPGRAIIGIGDERLALAAGSELDLGRLDSAATQIVLRRGRIGLHLAALDPAHSVEIDVPHGGIWLLASGDYDITAGDGQTPGRLAVLSGRARVVGDHRDTTLRGGSAATLGDDSPVAAAAAAADDFDAWWRPAKDADSDVAALRHVSGEMTGYHQLDRSGDWEIVAGYGAVWFPKAPPADWAPYRDGSWRWVAPWGWTWIDAMEWGFAPSHYGRWARIAAPSGGGERWGWVPGQPVAHPAYVPAAVAFLGTAGVGLSCPDATGPAVAWFPLAPGEVYWPRYTDDLQAIRQINAASVADAAALAAAADGGPPEAVVNGAYRNRRFASVVPRAAFAGGRPVAPALVQLPSQRLENAPLLAGSPGIAPAAPRLAIIAAAKTHIAHRLARAMHTLARILKPRRAAPLAKVAALTRPTHSAGGHLRIASAPHPHPRLHLVAAHRSEIVRRVRR